MWLQLHVAREKRLESYIYIYISRLLQSSPNNCEDQKKLLHFLYDISNLLPLNNGISEPHHLKTYSGKTNIVGRDGVMWDWGGGGGGMAPTDI